MVNKTLKIGGEIPRIKLYRFFSNKDYADQFVNGNIRFGWQKKYTSMEGNKREDVTEGNASFTIDGNKVGELFESGSFGGWESYILCTSEVDCSIKLRALSKRFSSSEDRSGYFVEINDLERFTEDIAKALKSSVYWDAIDTILWKKVVYTKYDHLGSGPPEVDLHSYQKPAYISTFEYKNKITGKIITLHGSHIYLKGKDKLADKYYPSHEWTKTETRYDYTLESEWRLIASIKMRQKVEHLKIPMFVTGSERDQRICALLKIDKSQLHNYHASEIEYLVPASSYWIDTLVTNSASGFHDYLEVEEIKFNLFSYLILSIRHLRTRIERFRKYFT